MKIFRISIMALIPLIAGIILIKSIEEQLTKIETNAACFLIAWAATIGFIVMYLKIKQED